MTERTIFLAALDCKDPAERAAFLDAACAGNPALRQRIEALLESSEQSGDFLEVPAVQQLAGGTPVPPRRSDVMSTESSVVGVYRHIDDAEDAVQKLSEGGFPIQHVSIVTKDLGTERKVHGFVTSCDVAKSSARTGAWVGGIFGALVGAAFLWVPGVGPMIVAGSLAAAMLGGVEGAVAGAAAAGILGWLTSLGISKEHILKYEESVRAGRCLVIAHGTPEETAKARQILAGTSPAALEVHAGA
jgi:hypothetical protein